MGEKLSNWRPLCNRKTTFSILMVGYCMLCTVGDSCEDLPLPHIEVLLICLCVGTLKVWTLLKQSTTAGKTFLNTKGHLWTCCLPKGQKSYVKQVEAYLFSPKFSPVIMEDFEIQFYFLMRTPAYRREETICDVICMLFRQIRNLSLMNRDVKTETFFLTEQYLHTFSWNEMSFIQPKGRDLATVR